MGIHVLCPKCGTEFKIQNESEFTQNNKILENGTYFLIPKNKIKSNIDLNTLLQNLSYATINDDGTIIIPQGPNNMKIIENNSSLDDVFAEFDNKHNMNNIATFDDIETSILNDGYIPNNRLWRRWIMAQMLRHYKTENGESGFDIHFVSGKPFIYSWETAKDEIKVLSKLSGTELILRERFFNMTVINEMAIDYEKRFWKYFKKQQYRYDKGYKKQSNKIRMEHTYIHLPRYGNIYISDNAKLIKETDMTVTTLKEKIAKYVDKITKAKNYKELYYAMDALMENCPMYCNLMKAYSWKNAFKGTGAYYTMDNMIKFHNCKWYVEENGTKLPLSSNKSLQMLENVTNEHANEYYKLYAIMCKFIEDNNFNFEAKMQELKISK